ncbi:MAG: hypothetical protein NHB15_03820 [Methanosarcina barkeri]|nr:hypothetical protein [Methanosarcina sp. ERenArc_MAG2]
MFQLSERLCIEGVDCNIDQYERSPAEGWPRWMNKQIDFANYILVVGTEIYEKRFKGRMNREKVVELSGKERS